MTRSDFDGLVCAALLKQHGILDDMLFVHPKDVQDGKVELSANDITTNLPYHPEVHLVLRPPQLRDAARPDDAREPRHDADADSAARVVYDHFGGAEHVPRHRRRPHGGGRQGRRARLRARRDPRALRAGSSCFLMDPRTGLGRFRDFRISNYQLMMQLIDACTTMSVDEILAHARRRRARRALPRATRRRKPRSSAAPRVHGNARGARPARRAGHPPDQPLHDLRAVPAVQHLDPRALGPAAAEHGVRDRQVDPRPLEPRRTSAS